MNSKKILQNGNPFPAIGYGIDGIVYDVTFSKLSLAAGALSCSIYAMAVVGTCLLLGSDLYTLNFKGIPRDVGFAVTTAGIGYASAYATNFLLRERRKIHGY